MASSHRIVFAIFIWLELSTFVFTQKESYVIYFREGRDKVAVTVEMDLREKVAFLNTINAESRRSQTVSLHDYSTNMIAFKDTAKNSCYLEKMNDASFVYERRLLKSLRNQVLLEQADVLYADDPPLTRREVLNIAGIKILNFCGRTVIYLVSDLPTHMQRRSKRSTRARTGHVQKTFSQHEHRSENYARFGHETTSYNLPQGSSKVTFIDPVVWPFNNNSQPASAFQLAAIRHLKRRNRDRNMRSFAADKPIGGNSFYGSGVGSAGLINTKIQTGYPGYPGFEANGQFALTHAGGFGQGTGTGNANGHAGTRHSIPFSQPKQHYGQQHVPQPYLPAFPNQNIDQHQQYHQGSQVFVPRPNGNGQGQYNPNVFYPQTPDDTGLSSQSRVELEKDKFHAGASSQNAFGTDSSKSQVQGSASRDGSFQGQAQSSSAFGSSRTQTQGSEGGAQSSSLSELKNIGISQTNTELAYNRSTAEATALTSSQHGSISSQSHGGKQGGQASSQAKGPGETSSSARVGFKEAEESKVEPFFGKAEASAQGGVSDGHSRTQVTGDHQGSIYTAVASGTYGKSDTTDTHQGPIAMALPGSDLSYLSQTPQQQPQMQTRDSDQSAFPNFHSQQFLPENQQHYNPLPQPQYYPQPVPRQPIPLAQNQGHDYTLPQTHQYPKTHQHHQQNLQLPAQLPVYYPNIHQHNHQNQPLPAQLPVHYPKTHQHHQQNQPPPTHIFPSNPKNDKPIIFTPQSFQNLNKQPPGSHFSQDKNSPFQQPQGIYFSQDKNPLRHKPYLVPGIIPQNGYPKSVPPQSVPAVNGFRTRVVTSHVQSFLPTPAIDVSKYQHYHGFVVQKQNGYQANTQNKQVRHVNPQHQQKPRFQNPILITKNLPSHQLPPANPTSNPRFPPPQRKDTVEQSKCTSSCFRGYRIVKTVKICKVASGCPDED